MPREPKPCWDASNERWRTRIHGKTYILGGKHANYGDVFAAFVELYQRLNGRCPEPDTEPLTITELVNAWLKAHGYFSTAPLKTWPKTARWFRDNLYKWIEFCDTIKAVRVDELTVNNLKCYLDYCRQRGWTSRSIGHYVSTARRVWDWGAGACELRFDFNCGTYFRGPGTTCSGPDACGQMYAQISGQDIGCPGEAFTITVTINGGNTAPYTVTLNNGGGTQTGPSPLIFTVTPTATTTYAIASAFDSLNQPIESSESVEILIPISPDCNANGVWDWCEMPTIEEFVAALVETGDPANRCLADMNVDGQYNGRDLEAYVVLILN